MEQKQAMTIEDRMEAQKKSGLVSACMAPICCFWIPMLFFMGAANLKDECESEKLKTWMKVYGLGPMCGMFLVQVCTMGGRQDEQREALQVLHRHPELHGLRRDRPRDLGLDRVGQDLGGQVRWPGRREAADADARLLDPGLQRRALLGLPHLLHHLRGCRRGGQRRRA
eukprot:SRR837773.8139.p3 GENE.SRR837773.8139~~SRR837773.8139.p3  ORF type:complete len:190 (-),score=45.87 SRR837773.8139:207-713(-)